jgi:hypothetical protein
VSNNEQNLLLLVNTVSLLPWLYRRIRPDYSKGWCRSSPGCRRRDGTGGRDWDSTVRHPGGYLHCHRHHVNALAVTKLIVKGEGEGSVFAVRLPCIVGDDQDADEELFDIEQERNGPKLSETKTSRLLRPSFLNVFNDMAPHCAHGAGAGAGADPSSSSSSSTAPPLQEWQPLHVRMNAVADSVLEIEVCSLVDDSDISRKRWYARKVLNATKEVHCEQAVDESWAVDMVRSHCNTVATVQQYRRGRWVDFASQLRYHRSVYQMSNMDGAAVIAVLRQLGYDGVILGLTGTALLSDRDAMTSEARRR